MELTIWSGNLRSQVLDACNSKGCPPRHFAEVFSTKWEDALRDASIKLATTFGPEVANQAYEKFKSIRQA
jgi:hypothetical protein